MDRLIIASAQIDLIENDHSENMKKVKAMATAITSECVVDVLLFPELCIEGNDFIGYSKFLTDNALNEIDTFWRGLARSLGKHVVTGKVCKRRGVLYDSAVCYTPYGDILAEYDKAHLYDGEREVFAAGDRLMTIKLGDFKIGLMICADLGFPEFSRAIARNNIDAFFVVSSWCLPYDDLWLLCCRARAAENACWLIACNRLGVEPSGRENCGCSAAIAPSGEVIANLSDRQGTYFTAEIRKKDVVQRRREIQWLEWLRPELY